MLGGDVDLAGGDPEQGVASITNRVTPGTLPARVAG